MEVLEIQSIIPCLHISLPCEAFAESLKLQNKNDVFYQGNHIDATPHSWNIVFKENRPEPAIRIQYRPQHIYFLLPGINNLSIVRKLSVPHELTYYKGCISFKEVSYSICIIISTLRHNIALSRHYISLVFCSTYNAKKSFALCC